MNPNNTRRKIYLLVICVCMVILGFSYTALSAYNRERERVISERYYVYCTLLKPEMNLDEVRKVLSQFGEYRAREYQHPGEIVRVYINYSEPSIDRVLGDNINLTFLDGKYVGASYHVIGTLDQFRSVCSRDP